MNLKKTLQQFGLKDKEARVYLAALELGSARANAIAKKSQIPSATCYGILELLREKGLVSRYIKGKVRQYSVDEPKKLIHLARQRMEAIERALPEIEALYGVDKNRPIVRFYEGKEAFNHIYQEILQDKNELLILNAIEDLFETIGDEHGEFVKERVKNKILARVILKNTPKARERHELGQRELRVVRFIPEHYDYHGALFVFGDKVGYFSYSKDYSVVVIESKELAATQKAALEYVWEHAGKYP